VTISRLRQHRHRAWLAALLVPLLCLRALVPTGFMPGMGTDGWVTLQLCTAQGLQQRLVPVNPPGGEPAPHAERSDCAYALAASASPATEAPRVPNFVSIATLAVATNVAVAAAGSVARSQSARGPPASLV